jgi:hypothetical protein
MRPRVAESTAADPQASEGADPKGSPLAQATRPKGLQHAFAEARRLQSILDAEPGLSVADLGRREGITGSRVSQMLGLLQLPAAMVATLDVAPEQAPKVATKQVRALVGLM